MDDGLRAGRRRLPCRRDPGSQGAIAWKDVLFLCFIIAVFFGAIVCSLFGNEI